MVQQPQKPNAVNDTLSKLVSNGTVLLLFGTRRVEIVVPSTANLYGIDIYAGVYATISLQSLATRLEMFYQGGASFVSIVSESPVTLFASGCNAQAQVVAKAPEVSLQAYGQEEILIQADVLVGQVPSPVSNVYFDGGTATIYENGGSIRIANDANGCDRVNNVRLGRCVIVPNATDFVVPDRGCMASDITVGNLTCGPEIGVNTCSENEICMFPSRATSTCMPSWSYLLLASALILLAMR